MLGVHDGVHVQLLLPTDLFRHHFILLLLQTILFRLSSKPVIAKMPWPESQALQAIFIQLCYPHSPSVVCPRAKPAPDQLDGITTHMTALAEVRRAADPSL